MTDDTLLRVLEAAARYLIWPLIGYLVFLHRAQVKHDREIAILESKMESAREAALQRDTNLQNHMAQLLRSVENLTARIDAFANRNYGGPGAGGPGGTP